jgi:hypothetical protein
MRKSIFALVSQLLVFAKFFGPSGWQSSDDAYIQVCNGVVSSLAHRDRTFKHAVVARFLGKSTECFAQLRPCPTKSNITRARLAVVQYDFFLSWCILFAKEKEVVDH